MHRMLARIRDCAGRFLEAMAYADPMALCVWPIEAAQPQSAAPCPAERDDLTTVRATSRPVTAAT